MKKRIFSLMIGAVVALASCSKSDEAPNLPQSGEQTATFSIEVPATRAEVTGLSRYIVEAYQGKDLATTPIRVEAATGSLTIELKKETEYTFVFWADYGTIAATDNYYDAATLQDVKVTPSAYATTATPAYCLAVSFNSKDFEAKKAVILKNATAQLNFTEAAGLLTADNSLTVKYSSGGKLNVATGAITEIGAEISRTYINIGMIAKDGTLTTDYILAPLGEKRLLDLKVTFNSEPEKTIASVPFQQSYKTNIKGEFSNMYASEFTISDQVEDYINNPDWEFPRVMVGDFYYDDNTLSSTFSATKTCIGIVYIVNPDGKTGKIVSLDEATSTQWSTENIDTSATSDTDGAANTSKVLALGTYSVSVYPAFAWCVTKNTTAPAGISWYIPAKLELIDGIYANKATLNTSLTAVSATVLSDDSYWSSTQFLGNYAWFVIFLNGSTTGGDKYDGKSVRAVSAF